MSRTPTAEEVEKARERPGWPFTVRPRRDSDGSLYFDVVDMRSGGTRATREHTYQARACADHLNDEIREHQP